MTLDELNRAEAARFVEALGSIFEHSPWVAESVVDARPFTDVTALHAAMCEAVARAGTEAQLRLIRAHPQLASKAAVRQELTAASNREQSGAGLTECTPEEFARLSALNDRYQQRFGFPFILAVRGYDRAGVIAQMAARFERDHDTEFMEALAQIGRIAAFRLNDLLSRDES